MDRTKIYLLSFIGTGALAVLIFWGINQWVESKIRSVLDEQKTEREFQYGNISVNLWANHGEIDSLSWISIQNNDTTFSFSCENIQITGISWLPWLFRDQVILQELVVTGPEIVMVNHGEDSTRNKQNGNHFSPPDNFNIEKLKIIKGCLTGYDAMHHRTQFYGEIDTFEIRNLRPSQDTSGSFLPVLMDAYSLNSDTVYYQINDLKYLTIGKLNIHDNNLTIDSLIVKSNYNRVEFQNHISYEKNWVDLLIPQIKVTDFSWKKQDSVLASSYVYVAAPYLNLAKDKTLPPYPNEKPLYSRLIRELPVRIDIDSIRVSDGTIVYDHYTRSTYSPGKVYIDQLNGVIRNIRNVGMDNPDFPKTEVIAHALLMKESRAAIDWSFYINDLRDNFIISGTLSKITQKGINYFVRPALDMEAKGSIDDVAFNFAGNKENAKGDFRIRYDDFHLYFLKKEGRRKQFFKSAFVNLFIHNTMKKPLEKKDITVKRPKNKSFWAYLWNMVQEGMRRTII